MNFYKEIELVLCSKTPQEKFERFWSFYGLYKEEKLAPTDEESKPLEFEHPSYNTFCTVVPPQKVPKRGALTTREGKINLIHAIAHIEYSAVDLALDAAYRFRGLPKKFYDDWLEVADDEIRHFLMLERLLEQLGARYGDVAVHNALFEASQKTSTLLERMAVVPRYLEANGLDATPMILQKLQKLPKEEILDAIQETLQVILQEEVEHVRKGDEWFRFTCKAEGVDEDVYFDIIKKYYPRGFLRPDDLNIEARRAAGFTCNELKTMANREVC